jgi:hypothetical protein
VDGRNRFCIRRGMSPSEFIIHWNRTFPMDYWYRNKFSLRFNSKEHREIEIFDIYLEFKEDKFYNKFREEFIENEEKKKDYEKFGILKPREMVVDESLFDDFDYSEFDEK